MKHEEFNIMSNIKVVESLKAELICIIGDLYKLLTKGSNVARDSIVDCISGAITILYILGEKLGYSYMTIDKAIQKKLKVGIIEEDPLEKNGKELSRLYEHIGERHL